MSPAIAAWSAGNNLVLKPSELTPATGKVLKKIILECFPKERVLLVEGDSEVSNKILDEKFDYIFFTGSTKVGRIVMQKAANHLTPVTLELGGKSPCIVDVDANLELAAKRICWGKFINAGQTCIAPDYILVHQDVKDELVKLLIRNIKSFYGEDASKSLDFARIVNSNHLARLSNLIKDQKILIGGNANPNDKFFPPTIVDEPSWESSLMEEEIFGPILPIISFKHKEDYSSKIRSRPKPLALYYFSTDERKQDAILKEFSFGGGCINDTVMHIVNQELPFGGVGESGMGCYHGRVGFFTFCHAKSIYRQTNTFDVPLRYPPYNDKEKWLKLFQK
jgi:aldehyde dehydrogenase (NAD+)